MIEIQPAQPDQGGDIVRLELQRPVEVGQRLLRLAAALVQVPEEIRPAGVAGRQVLTCDVTRIRVTSLLNPIKRLDQT